MNEEYQEYRRKWEEYPKHFVQERVPLHLDLELTTRCNFKCIMCVHSFDPPEPRDMKLDLAKQIINEFTAKGGYAIKYCYIGEPALYPHLSEIIRYSKDHGIVDARLATNGSLINTKLAHELVEMGLDLIIFSVDSMFPEIYKQIRVGGNLYKVLQNIIELKKYRDSLGLDKPKIQIQAIPMDLNKEELETKIYHKFYGELADTVWQSPWCKDLVKKYELGETPNFRCHAPFQRIMVRANGDIWLCCGTRILSKYIGKYSEMNLEEAWNSEFIKKVRIYLNEGKAHLIEPCKSCEERYYVK